MKKIQRLIKDMCYELDAAEHYAKHALRNKDEDKELGDVYERVARQELEPLRDVPRAGRPAHPRLCQRAAREHARHMGI